MIKMKTLITVAVAMIFATGSAFAMMGGGGSGSGGGHMGPGIGPGMGPGSGHMGGGMGSGMVGAGSMMSGMMENTALRKSGRPRPHSQS